MEGFINIFSNVKRLKKATKDLTVTQLTSIYDKLGNILEERKQQEEEARKEEQVRLEKIEEIKLLIQEEGIDIVDLVPAKLLAKKNKQTKKPKYKFIDGNGVEQTWSGQGKTPVAMQKQMDEQGKTKEEFLIGNI